MPSRRDFLRWASLAAGGCLTGTLGYAFGVEPHWIEYVERDLPIAYLPLELAGRTLVHLSDLHVGPRVADAYLLEVFARVVERKADFIVYTGDLAESEPGMLRHAERIYAQGPRGRLATLGVLGNHDYGRGASEYRLAADMAAMLGECGIRILRNQVANVAGLQVIGLDDLWARRFEPGVAFQDWDPARASLALSHNPDSADRPGWGRYRGWILAGHTHGGQCKAPFLTPPRLPVRNKRYIAGEVPLADGRRLYISRGVGHLMQARFNVRPEATFFRLRQAAPGDRGTSG